MENVVRYALDGSIATINIDNPPVNALSVAVRRGLLDALERAREDGCEAVLLSCDGRTFIAGADITEFGKPPASPSLPEVVKELERFPKPVFVALHGNVLGGGLEVAMAAHYRGIVPGTKLGLPEVKLGLIPGAGGTQRLPRLVGAETALEMMTTGKPITAEEALRLGLTDVLLEGAGKEDALRWVLNSLGNDARPRPTAACKVPSQPPVEFFDEYRKRIAQKTRGQIAPEIVVELVELAMQVPVSDGQLVERERFLQCRESPQSAALRHVFFAERATSRASGIPADTPSRSVDGVAVIGAGTMGRGIAMAFANAGLPVCIVESNQERLEQGLEAIGKSYATSVRRGRLDASEVASRMACLVGTTDYEDIADVDLVVEAVFEDLDVKKEVFRKLDDICKPGCVLATNTSYLDVNEIAAATGRPENVIGAHFFSPAHVMKLLEVVRGEGTAPEVVQTFMKLAKSIGKLPVPVGVCNGFVGNRMLRPYARQAQLLLLEVGTPEPIDRAMESWGMAMGPLAVGDLAGLDISYRSRLAQGIKPHSLREYAVADALVEMDRLGQKSGAGYYRYDGYKRSRQVDERTIELILRVGTEWGVPQRSIEESELIDRLLLALINEGAAILRERIAARPSDIDVIYLNGYGFPSWRGGPMFQADQLGLDLVLDKLAHLKKATGDTCWDADPLLVELAERGEALSTLNQA